MKLCVHVVCLLLELIFLLTVNDIKKARYYLQVEACVIYSKSKLRLRGYWKWCINSFVTCQQKQDKWKAFLLKTDPRTYGQFACLYATSYIALLHKLIRWYFALDHYNYAR